jgi:hypothetical protein
VGTNGKPSEFEKNLQRRESPGLTRVGQASVSFCPLQGLSTTKSIEEVSTTILQEIRPERLEY